MAFGIKMQHRHNGTVKYRTRRNNIRYRQRPMHHMGNNSFRRTPLANKKQREKIFNKFKNEEVNNVHISNNRIKAKYGKHNLSYPFIKLNHLKTIGNWDHKIDKDRIKIDKDVKDRNVAPLLVHEAVEQFLVKDEGLPTDEAHKIATGAEREYAKEHNIPWRNYQISVMKTKI